MAVAALVVALVGVVIASASLAWQVYSWRRTGPALKVSASNALVASGPRTGVNLIQVKAVNRGRSSLQVTGWGFQLPDGSAWFGARQYRFSSPLPTTLDGGHEAAFFVEEHALHDYLANGTPLIPFVNTSLGRVEGRPISR